MNGNLNLEFPLIKSTRLFLRVRSPFRVALVGLWLVLLALLKAYPDAPLIYFLPLLSLVSCFVLDVFAAVVCGLLTSAMVAMSPVVAGDAQLALLGVFWASLILIAALRHLTDTDSTASEAELPGREFTRIVPASAADTAALQQAKTRFARYVSHDLRTPINLILGFSESILTPPMHQREHAPHLLHEKIEAIHRNARILQKLVDEFVLVSRLEKDAGIGLPRPLAPAASIRPGAPAILVIDEGQEMASLFRQYMPRVRVMAAASVEHTGHLPPEPKPQAVIFPAIRTPHQQAAVTSAVGAGVPLITCTIPTLRQTLRNYSHVEHMVKPIDFQALSAAFGRLESSPSSILLIDDSHDLVQMFSLMLATLAPSARLWKAYSGREGLALFAEQPVDLIIVDLRLPDADGLSLIDTFRGVPRAQDVPILLISGAQEADIAPVCREWSVSVQVPAGLQPSRLIQGVEALVSALTAEAQEQ